MAMIDKRSTRRDFFVKGGAALGAGVAATAGAAALAPTQAPAQPDVAALQRELAAAADREAIARLHQRFIALVGGGQYGAVAGLFAPEARLALGTACVNGRRGIDRLFADYRCQDAPAIHSAYRRNPLHPPDAVTVAADGLRATARFHVEAEISAPLQGDSTVAQMARLQGHFADRRWESGRFEMTLLKLGGEWKVLSLEYAAT